MFSLLTRDYLFVKGYRPKDLSSVRDQIMANVDKQVYKKVLRSSDAAIWAPLDEAVDLNLIRVIKRKIRFMTELEAETKRVNYQWSINTIGWPR